MILLAHILGMPVEELVAAPISAAASAMLVGLASLIASLRYRWGPATPARRSSR
jgi:hypothetical protein